MFSGQETIDYVVVKKLKGGMEECVSHDFKLKESAAPKQPLGKPIKPLPFASFQEFAKNRGFHVLQVGTTVQSQEKRDF